MKEEQLLEAARTVFVDAIEQAEFTRAGKDLQYAQIVAEAHEKLEASIQKRPICGIRLFMANGKMCREVTLDSLPFLDR